MNMVVMLSAGRYLDNAIFAFDNQVLCGLSLVDDEQHIIVVIAGNTRAQEKPELIISIVCARFVAGR